MDPSGIKCEGLVKRFGVTEAVGGVSLEIAQGQILALLGPSGCGKTTLLRLIAGYEHPDAGTISIRGRTVVGPKTWVPPEKRRIGFVFQDYALFPHMSVAGNVAFGVKGMKRAQRRARVEEMLALVGLAGLGSQHPHELSGGQQQRVALARALAPGPDLILLDEPFSNLDAGLRRQVREDVRQILTLAGATAVFVTHDQEESLSLGSLVAVMREGHILEVGSPKQIYLSPRHPSVAEAVGVVNLLRGESLGVTVGCALGQLPIAHPCRTGPMNVLLRPESIHLKPAPLDQQAGEGSAGVVEDVHFHGNHQHVAVSLPNGEQLRVRVGPEQALVQGQRVTIQVTAPVLCFSRED